MTPDERAARLAAADDLAQLAKRMASDLSTILRTARTLADPGKEIGRSVCTLKRYEGMRQAYAEEAGKIARALDPACVTSQKTRQARKATYERNRRESAENRAKIAEAEARSGDWWRDAAFDGDPVAERMREPAGARKFGGVMGSVISITEIAA